MCQWLYASQLKLLVTISALDIACFLARIYLYFNPSIVNVSFTNIQSTIAQQGFILDCIGSVIPTSAMVVMSLLLLAIFCLNCATNKQHTGVVFATIGVQPIRRMLTMRCNCPCYRTRPKLRFIVRMFILILCIIFRMVAAILYSKANFQLLTILCATFEVCLIMTLAVDIYHYRVWWHYRPGNDNVYRPGYSPKHRRYLPYHLLGKNRNEMTLGNGPCKREDCNIRELEHILIYHYSEFQPQKRWPEIKDKTNFYVGFHRTSADAAVNIAHSDMLPSRTPPQMLGFGIYFARSIKHTEGKARHGTAGGGIICAKIRMGKVLEIDKTQIAQVRNTDTWHANYDTVYYSQDDEKRDEFCIKSSDQILKWVMVIEEGCDPKVRNYGLDTEFSNTRCGCI